MPYTSKDFAELFGNRREIKLGQVNILETIDANAQKYLDVRVAGYRCKTTICGNFARTEVYPVWDKRPKGLKAERNESRKEAQNSYNKKKSARHCADIMNTNFRDGDFWLTLTYTDEHHPKNCKAAADLLRRYIDRVRRKFRKLKYIYTTERGRNGHIHHHMVTNCRDYDLLKDRWTLGTVDEVRPLKSDDTGYTALANYFCDPKKDKGGERLYVPSRNLEKPIIYSSDAKLSKKKVTKLASDDVLCAEVSEKIVPGFKMTERQTYISHIYPGVYIKVSMKKRN
ncbi:hypothetical protein FACS1894208_01350 [Clostridia bacterium]|nr:hypothetical protein FACS1894208_01350 [Clostridia bacterium]